MPHARTTAADMYPLVERYLDGHQTQRAFCREHGLPVSRLNYWLAKYRRQAAQMATHRAAEHTDAFVDITPRAPLADRAFLELIYPHGVRLRLFEAVEPAYLARLITLGTSER